MTAHNTSPFASLQTLKQQLVTAEKNRQHQAEQSALAQQQAQRDRALILTELGVKPTEATSLDDESALFAAAVKGVKRISQVQTPLVQTQHQYKTKITNADVLARRASAEGIEGASVTGISDTEALLNPVSSEATLSFKHKNVPYRIFEQLKAGEIRWYQAVDLHSCTIEQARAAVLLIIEQAAIEQQNSLKIVHGKGQNATLKTCVNGWLKQHPDVLAFCSAPEKQGGTGAVLVLIRRGKDK